MSMRSSAARAAVVWCVLAVVIAGLQLVTVASASPFIFSADTGGWREDQPVRLEGKAYAVAVAVAPVVNFPLRQIILGTRAPHTSLVDRVLPFLFPAIGGSAKVTSARLDVSFALINTAIWLLIFGLLRLLWKFLRARRRQAALPVASGANASAMR
jgi:hypothetical protein